MLRTIAMCSVLAAAMPACDLGPASPGSRQGEPVSTSSFALECHVGQPGDEGYCTESCPCEIGEGDCNVSAQCAPGLKCSFNVGAEYGFPAGVDVCTCPAESLNGAGTFCSERCPCDEGQGDCDSDAECAPGLTCYRGVGASYGFTADIDVCATCLDDSANGTDDFCTESCPCDEGQGDCDSDAECAPGLHCYIDAGAAYGLPATMEVCAACPPSSRLGKHDYCTTECPCDEGEGDCDSDDECAPGLHCYLDSGADFGLPADIEVCAACPPPSRLGKHDFCTPECPCAEGQGDCDSDAECKIGLVCADNAGATYGFTADTDVCVPAP